MVTKEFPAFFGLARDFTDYATLCDDRWIVTKENDGFKLASNVCHHMGMPFLQGNIEKPCKIKCPYHGKSTKEELLSVWGEGLFHNTVLVTPDIKRILGDLGEEYQTLYNEVDAPFWLWMQNTMDLDHVEHVHDDFKKVFTLPITTDSSFVSLYDYSMHDIAVNQKTIESVSRHAKVSSDYFRHFTIGLNLSITSFLGVLYSIETVEETTTGCRVKTRYFASKSAKPDWAIIKQAKLNNEKIIAEDVSICERLAPTFLNNGFHSSSEKRIKAYHELLATHGVKLV